MINVEWKRRIVKSSITDWRIFLCNVLFMAEVKVYGRQIAGFCLEICYEQIEDSALYNIHKLHLPLWHAISHRTLHHKMWSAKQGLLPLLWNQAYDRENII